MKRLAIFARWPAPGAVKSRLSPALPAALACDLYRAMLDDALAVVAESAAEECYLYWADPPADQRGFETPDGVLARHQVGIDLGERLGRAFGELLTGPGDRVIAIGADCPDLAAGVIDEGFEALSACDLVLGPASDGGYVLLGLRRPEPGLFTRIDWGTDRVLEQTLERATLAGLETSLLSGLADLDTPNDLVRFVARRAFTSAPSGRRTEAALSGMGLLPAPV